MPLEEQEPTGILQRTSAPRPAMNDSDENTDRQGLEIELARLRQEHRDLDAAIDALERNGICDQLQVQRLKKRKLVIKDKIMGLEDSLTPDIIA